MAYLEINGIKKRFGTFDVIHGLDLAIEEGEFVVFVGPSGCGKSTALRMICGLETLTDGDVRIDGVSVRNVAPSKRGVAMVFQSYALYPHMTVAENMGFSLRIEGVSKAERQAKVLDAARILQLQTLLERRPKELSGGQRQRVAIGRAIVRKPKIFLFDEPLSNLDAELRVQMRLELARLHKELKTTMIYVTHDQVEAMTLADRIVVLRDGRIEQVGSPLELYNNPANAFVAGFIGSPKMNFIDATAEQASPGRVKVSFPGLVGESLAFQLADDQATALGGQIKLGIRPEHLVVDAASDHTIDVSVNLVERLGNLTFAHGTTPDRHEIVATSLGQADIEVDRVHVTAFNPSNCFLFDQQGFRIPRIASLMLATPLYWGEA